MDYNGDIESKEYPGFYLVPGLKHTYIDRLGRVVDAKRQCCALPFMTSLGYPTVNVEGLSRHVHRLLALTFLPRPEANVEELDVNHIDGVKTHNSLDNLEWATRSENCLHAYQTGLRDDNVPVLVKDLRDGSIARYYSLHECARAFDVDAFTIHHHLKPVNRGKVSWKYYVLIREGQEWPEIDPSLIGAYRNGHPKPVAVVSADNTQVVIFESLGAAARAYDFNVDSVRHHMHKKGSQLYHGYTFWYVDDGRLYNKQGEVFTGLVQNSPTR